MRLFFEHNSISDIEALKSSVKDFRDIRSVSNFKNLTYKISVTLFLCLYKRNFHFRKTANKLLSRFPTAEDFLILSDGPNKVIGSFSSIEKSRTFISCVLVQFLMDADAVGGEYGITTVLLHHLSEGGTQAVSRTDDSFIFHPLPFQPWDVTAPAKGFPSMHKDTFLGCHSECTFKPGVGMDVFKTFASRTDFSDYFDQFYQEGDLLIPILSTLVIHEWARRSYAIKGNVISGAKVGAWPNGLIRRWSFFSPQPYVLKTGFEPYGTHKALVTRMNMSLKAIGINRSLLDVLNGSSIMILTSGLRNSFLSDLFMSFGSELDFWSATPINSLFPSVDLERDSEFSSIENKSSWSDTPRPDTLEAGRRSLLNPGGFRAIKKPSDLKTKGHVSNSFLQITT